MTRTTITLDPDVDALLAAVMREQGLTFKDAVNSSLRRGLAAPGPRVDVSFPSYDMGVPRIDVSRALSLAGQLEDEEIAQKLSQGR